MESSDLDLSEKDKKEIEEYKKIIQDIIQIKDLLQIYNKDHNSLRCDSYYDLIKKLSYLKNKQSTISKRIRSLYKEIYKK